MSNIPLRNVRPLDSRKSAIIVGGSSGIGAALVRKLVTEGYSIAAVARRERELQELCDSVNQTPPIKAMAFYYVHDVADYDVIPALFQQITSDLGGLDLIIYAAAYQPVVQLDEYNFEKDNEMIKVNLLGAMAWLGQAATRFEQTDTGQIVAISSIAADRGRVANPAYNSSKAGLDTYMEALRNRLSRKGISVTTVKPGFTQTRLLENAQRAFWVISPEKAAELITKAVRRQKQVAYIPERWRFLSLIIRHIPSIIFRRLSF